ncbi:MAG: hypothetical protein L6R40_006147 [Gallowayella cf. fulva]|nr:MAG: hypothetical protein L6R40_006147 [Xanthomendoza cf. fulva]
MLPRLSHFMRLARSLSFTANGTRTLSHHQLLSPLKDQARNKRAPPQKPDDYRGLICNGTQLLENIERAFYGAPGGIRFQASQSDNGWSRETENGELKAHWKPAFSQLFKDTDGNPKSAPPSSEIKQISLQQEKEYYNYVNDRFTVFTNAYCEANYFTTRGLIMAMYTLSPSTPNNAHFAQLYLPASSAIIVSAIRSPASEVRRLHNFAGQTPPSTRILPLDTSP